MKVVEEIYEESKYGVNDLYRIPDIIHSLDRKQWSSKMWLADELKRLTTDEEGRIFIAGGWYGLLAEILREKYPRPGNFITTVDIDPMAEYYGQKLFPDRDYQFITDDAFANPDMDAFCWVSTSGEHVEREVLADWILRKPNEDTWIAVQSNDYYEHQSHINCYPDVDEFAKSLPLKYFVFKGTLNLGDFNRFLVIGK